MLPERHPLEQKDVFTNNIHTVGKILFFLPLQSKYLPCCSGQCNKQTGSVYICTHTHMLDDIHLDGRVSITIWDVIMFRFKEMQITFCSGAAQPSSRIQPILEPDLIKMHFC